MNIIQKSTSLKFILLCICNTFLSMCIMYFCYNLLKLGYWGSTAIAYFLGSIFSFIANKLFTFASKKRTYTEIIYFAINIVICYILSYLIAKPILYLIISKIQISISKEVNEQLAMLLGMCIFTLLNFFGQKKIVFK